MSIAMFWESLEGSGKVLCRLCPHNCTIDENRQGICGVRGNREGKLHSFIYGRACSLSMDPIEKKPLYHFYPGSRILSAGTYGCNFSCDFCQNWSISNLNARKFTDEFLQTHTVRSGPEELVEQALEMKGNIGLAYTYNEPTVWYEFVYDTSRMAQRKNLKNVLITNGFMNQEPLRKLLPHIDAANVDIKSIRPDFYTKYCGGALEPVLSYCKTAVKKAFLEITNLLIPGLNDSREDVEQLVVWIYRNLGKDTPLHFSRYRPQYKMEIPATETESMERAKEIADKKLNYVYLGNIRAGEDADTYCPFCGRAVIERDGMSVTKCHMKGACCYYCKYDIPVRGECRESRW